MALPYASEPTQLEVKGTLVSQPYVAMTLAVMESFGVTVGNRKFRRFDVRPARYTGANMPSSPTPRPPAISLPWPPSRGARSRSKDWARRACKETWRSWTCSSTWAARSRGSQTRTTVIGGPLRAVDVDMNAFSDTVMTLAVVALFASGVSRIRNVAHIRHKETDRMAALATELRQLGAGSTSSPTAW